MTPDEDRNVRERLDMIRKGIANNLRVLSRRPDDECQLSDLSEAVMGLDDVGLPGVAATLAELIEPDEERTCNFENATMFSNDYEYRCAGCGELFSVVTYPRFCPRCGARLVSGNESGR